MPHMNRFNRFCFFAVSAFAYAVDTTISQLRKVRKKFPEIDGMPAKKVQNLKDLPHAKPREKVISYDIILQTRVT